MPERSQGGKLTKLVNAHVCCVCDFGGDLLHLRLTAVMTCNLALNSSLKYSPVFTV